MRSLDAKKLVEGAARAGYFPLGTIDGHVLPRQLVEVFDRGEQARVPILAGFNSGEIRSLRFLAPPVPTDAATYETSIRERYRDLADDFLQLYPAAALGESILAATRDALYGWTAERLVAKQTALGQHAFLYLFDHGYPAADSAGLHAFHAAELPYVFGTADRTPPLWPKVPATAVESAAVRCDGRLLDEFRALGSTWRREPTAMGCLWLDARIHGLRRHAAARRRTSCPACSNCNEAVVCRRREHGGLPGTGTLESCRRRSGPTEACR